MEKGYVDLLSDLDDVIQRQMTGDILLNWKEREALHSYFRPLLIQHLTAATGDVAYETDISYIIARYGRKLLRGPQQ